MDKQYLYGYAVILLVINLAWFFLLPVNHPAIEDDSAKTNWHLSPPSAPGKVELAELLQTGFWGEGSLAVNHSSSGATVKEIEQAEATKLKARLKAIINRDNQAYVLFSDGEKIHRIVKGESLTGSDWILIDVGGDWLILQKQGGGATLERLSLFSTPISKDETKD